MIKKIIEIFSFLDKSQQKKIIYLQLLILLTALMEVLSLFAIAPFVSIIVDFEVINREGYISNIYSYLGFESPRIFLFFFALFFLCILYISNLTHMLTIWLVTTNSVKMGTTLGTRMYSFYLNREWLFHVKNNSAQLINKIAQESDRITLGIILPTILMIAKLAVSLFIVTAMIIYNPLVALIVGVILGTCYFTIWTIIKTTIMKNGIIVTLAQEKRFKLMSEGFGGIKELLISGRQGFFSNLFRHKSDEWANAVGNNQALSQIPRFIIELIAFSIIVGFILFITSIKNENNFISLLPVLSIYVLGGLKLLPAFQAIFTYLTSMKSNISAYDNIRQNLIDCKEEEINESILKKDTEILIEMDLKKELRFQNVYFKYLDKEKKNNYVVSDLNFSIKKNQTTGIVGKSGSGKSTIIDLIVGLIPPDSGKIFIDDKNLMENNKHFWQKNISLVSQSIFLSDNTIRENIAFGIRSDKIDDDQVYEVLERSQLKEYVNQLPDGINTIIGEHGVQLSGGQRQRVGIARSLYSNSKLIIFDEATSSLDGLTEAAIIKSINDIQNAKTIVIVAHRLASVKKCHKIYFVDSGKIIDSGTYQELVDKNELFRQMVKINII
tara:strand:- start:6329 stop:8158 length:1830 start_codon:yes stop_codon:yes gene_type:complete